MRIALVTGEYPPMQGGVGAYSHILAEHLLEQGHKVWVYSNQKADTAHPRIPVMNEVNRWTLGSLQQLNRWAQKERIDLINLQFQTAAFGMSPWIHFLPLLVNGIPVVTTFHDLRVPYLFPKAGPLRRWMVNQLARSSSGTIVTNQEDLVTLHTLPRVALIPIGSNIQAELPPAYDTQTWRSKAGAKANDFLIGYFGLFNRSKGLEVLFESLRELHSQELRARLIMIGGGAGDSDPSNLAYLDEMRLRIAELGLEPAIHWTGYVDESSVGAYLSACDVVALPFLDGASHRRGSLMAALHYGCAIITTQPAVEEPAFKHRENFYFIPPNDVAALTRALAGLRESPELRDRLKEGAQALAKAYNWATIAEDYVQFFERVLRKTTL